MTAFCTSTRFMEHLTGPHHPERPDRLRAIFAAVREAGLIDSPNPLASADMRFELQQDGTRLMEIQPYPASVEQLALIHAPRHIERVRIRCEAGGLLDDGDTIVSRESYDAALLAAGAGLRCVDAVMSGEANAAFAAVRPPGHHAEANAAMGFCLFNSIALAARYAQNHYGLQRVAIVDFDVHHGNGTQAILLSDPTVLLVSMHEDPHSLYPHSGYSWEIGAGEGKGAILNIPLLPGCGDGDYLHAMREQVVPRLDAFAPELLLISAGFDAHVDDPLADMKVTETGYFEMTRVLRELAERHCAGRIVSILEGGYNPRALGRSVVAHLRALEGRK